MKFFKKQIATTIALLSLVWAATAQTPLQYVPADVPFLLTFNLDQLNKKVSWEELRQFDFFSGMLKEMKAGTGSDAEKAYLKKMMESPSAVGYDLLQPFHFFMQTKDGINYYALVMKMSDRAKYEAGLQELKSDEYLLNLSENGTFKMWLHSDETYCWNDEVVLNIWAEKETNYGDWSYAEPVEIPEGEWPTEEEIVYEEPTIEEPMKEDLPNEPIMEIEALPGPEEVIVFDVDTIIPPPEAVEEYPTDYPEYNAWADNAFNNWEPSEKKDSLAAFAKKIMERQSAGFLASLPKYRSALAEKRPDIHFWMDYAYMFKALQDNPAMAMMGGSTATMMQSMQGLTSIFYENSFVSAGLNFQDGKMAMDMAYYPTEDILRFYRAAMDAKLNKKLLKYVEGGDKLFGYYYFNMSVKNSIEEGKALMHKALNAMPEYGAMASDAMKIAGIFIDEDAIANLLKGDFLVAVSGLKMMEKQETITDYDEDFNMSVRDTIVIKELPVVTMLASYGSQKDIQHFINMGVHAKVLQPMGKYFKMEVPQMGSAYLVLHKGVMIFTNDYNLVARNLDSGFKRKQRLGKEHRKLLCQNSSVFFWDIPQTLYAIGDPGSTAGDPMTGYLDMFAKQFDNLTMTSSKKVDASVKSSYDFNFVNKGTNSLKQFFTFVNDIYIELLGGAKI